MANRFSGAGTIMIDDILIAKDSQKQPAAFWYLFDFLYLTITPLRKATPKQAPEGVK